jgi:CRP/FNR family transcriptional regulator, cyclic AMP receptor protein
MSFRGLTSFAAPPRPDVRSTVARLEALEVFPDASTADLRRIVEAGHTVPIPQGWSLIWEKTPADKAYVVLSGTASVQHDRQEFAQIAEGELIGEMAIVNNQLRSASVVATTPLEVLHFTREAVEGLGREVPAFRDALENATVSRAS